MSVLDCVAVTCAAYRFVWFHLSNLWYIVLMWNNSGFFSVEVACLFIYFRQTLLSFKFSTKSYHVRRKLRLWIIVYLKKESSEHLRGSLRVSIGWLDEEMFHLLPRFGCMRSTHASSCRFIRYMNMLAVGKHLWNSLRCLSILWCGLVLIFLFQEGAKFLGLKNPSKIQIGLSWNAPLKRDLWLLLVIPDSVGLISLITILHLQKKRYGVKSGVCQSSIQ